MPSIGAVLVYVILTIVTVCVTIVVTYFLLNNEDYRCRSRPPRPASRPWPQPCASLARPRPQMALDVVCRLVLHLWLRLPVLGAP